MKSQKITYWVTTSIVALMMLMSGPMYFVSPEAIEGFRKIGFPDFFRMELGAAKVIGALVLLIPMIPSRIKEWAYAGFGITFISAFIAHLASGDPMSKAIAPIVVLAVLAVSNVTYHKLNK